ncbi:M16 family metallopeptidase [Salisaeta longa]|uniref:M16 family metallopeptidase n=1 Tax=Salisaeta longa TaxID=503170 RepID=UPI0004193CD7|nr:pitrilysin family protein [Salisaeta longa]
MLSRFSKMARCCGLLLLILCLAPAAHAQSMMDQFADDVTTFTLDNGLTFVVIERHDAPVVSFHTYADVGSVNEPQGQTGIAHMFEHMAFKGTTSIGSKNIQKEMAALQRQADIYQELMAERAKGRLADSTRLRNLEEKFKAAREEAQSYVAGGAYENLLERNGVAGLNAYTSADATGYIYSLPANKLELFFALEADRFRNPVLREFYTERNVVMEERRQRTESNPIGRLLEETLAAAFKAHPYGAPTIGHMSDLQTISRTQAKQFYETYYVASNLTIGIAGDVNPEQVKALAQEYFGPMADKKPPLPVTTEEPKQLGERRVIIRESTQPFIIMGYHRGSMFSPDDPVYDILASVLSNGRTSRLYKQLVETGKALNAQAISSFPGDKYPSLFALFAVPNRGVSPDSVEQMVYDVLERIKTEGITQEELERAKTKARANLIQGLDSNSGLARAFSRMEALTGDWRNVFRRLDALQAVTAADVQRVAQDTFVRSNRTVGMIKSADDAAPTASAQ